MVEDTGMNDETIKEVPGHFNDKRKPEGFDTKRVFVTPSIIYAGMKQYARPFRYSNICNVPILN